MKGLKVLIVNGSSHENGTTAAAIAETVKYFEKSGVETEIFQLGGEPIADCLQCGYCSKNGKCVFDDRVNEFAEKAKAADGFIFASPVYYAHPSGRLLSFLDRLFYSADSSIFRGKPGAAIAVARRSGTTASFDVINKYFGISGMPVAGSTYWNNVYGLNAEDAPCDAEGLQTMRNLAANMVWMMRCFALGRESGMEYPAPERGSWTNFIRR